MQQPSDRVDYILECFKTAREELLLRVEHRDRWLKQALIAQVVLWAISKGIKFQLEAGGKFPDALAFAIPVAFFFSLFYYVEDGLVGRLSRYIGTLSIWEARLRQTSVGIPNWDASVQLTSYADGIPLKLRVIGQLSAFLFFPALLASDLYVFPCFPFIQWFLLLGIAVFILLGYIDRRKTGKIDWTAKDKMDLVIPTQN